MNYDLFSHASSVANTTGSDCRSFRVYRSGLEPPELHRVIRAVTIASDIFNIFRSQHLCDSISTSGARAADVLLNDRKHYRNGG